jgi:hypothetical protein
MVYFQTKNPNLGKFWRFLLWKMLVYLVYFVTIWYSLWLFGINFPHFGMLTQEKSGNPVKDLNHYLEFHSLLPTDSILFFGCGVCHSYKFGTNFIRFANKIY